MPNAVGERATLSNKLLDLAEKAAEKALLSAWPDGQFTIGEKSLTVGEDSATARLWFDNQNGDQYAVYILMDKFTGVDWEISMLTVLHK